MADTQIYRGAVSDVPAEYVLPESAEFTLKCVNADFTDNGAAGDWLPCVTILSDSGHVIARAVDQAVLVTGGDDAEVSWFPGVKHAGASAPLNLDWSSPQQFAPVFEIGRWAGGPFAGFDTLTQDSACFHGGRLVASGAQGDGIAFRFGLSPQGSVWGFYMMHTTGPDHGIAFFYLGRLPDDDPFANPAEPDPVNLLGEIDAANGDFTYILGAKINCYSAALTRNVVHFFGFKPLAPFTATDFRITGEPGHAMTTPGVDTDLSLVTTGDGGPGVYALKIVMEDKQAASAGYKLGIQSLAAARTDAIWT